MIDSIFNKTLLIKIRFLLIDKALSSFFGSREGGIDDEKELK